MAGRENEEKLPLLRLPPDYVSLNVLRERWLKAKEEREGSGGDPLRAAVPITQRHSNTASAVEANRPSPVADGENGKRTGEEVSGKPGSSGGKFKGRKNKKANQAEETLGEDNKFTVDVDGLVSAKKKVTVVVNPMAQIEREVGDFPMRRRKGVGAGDHRWRNRNARFDRTAQVGLKIGDNSTGGRKSLQDDPIAGSGQRIGNMSKVARNEGEVNFVKNMRSDRMTENGQRTRDKSTGDVRDGRKYADGNRTAGNGRRIADISEDKRRGEGARNIEKSADGDHTAGHRQRIGDFHVRGRKGFGARGRRGENRNAWVDRTAQVGLKIGDNSTEGRNNLQDDPTASSWQRIGNTSTVAGNKGEANFVKIMQSDRTTENRQRTCDKLIGDVRDGRKYVDGDQTAENGRRIVDISEKEREGDGARNIEKNVDGYRMAEHGRRIGDLSTSYKKGANGRRNVRSGSEARFRDLGRVNYGKMQVDSSLIWVRKEEKSVVRVAGNCH